MVDDTTIEYLKELSSYMKHDDERGTFELGDLERHIAALGAAKSEGIDIERALEFERKVRPLMHRIMMAVSYASKYSVDVLDAKDRHELLTALREANEG